MLPGLVVATIIDELIGLALMALLDVRDGEMITSAGAAGWAAAVFLLAVMLLPLLWGVVLANRSVRLQRTRLAIGALGVNAVLLVGLVVIFVANIVLA